MLNRKLAPNRMLNTTHTPELFDDITQHAPYRVGRKQKRAVLDKDGLEVVVFPEGRELYAELFCNFLNRLA